MILSICSYVSDLRYIEIVLFDDFRSDSMTKSLQSGGVVNRFVCLYFLSRYHWNSHAACADAAISNPAVHSIVSNREVSKPGMVFEPSLT